MRFPDTQFSWCWWNCYWDIRWSSPPPWIRFTLAVDVPHSSLHFNISAAAKSASFSEPKIASALDFASFELCASITAQTPGDFALRRMKILVCECLVSSCSMEIRPRAGLARDGTPYLWQSGGNRRHKWAHAPCRKSMLGSCDESEAIQYGREQTKATNLP